MTQPTFDPNQALSGDLFSQTDLSTGFTSDVVAEGEYTLALSARLVKKPDNIIYVEGKVQAGPDAGKTTKVFNVILDANTSKRGNQKGIALTNLASVGIDLPTLNLLAKQTGAAPGNFTPLYEAIVPLLEGRVVNAYLTVNTYNGKNGEVTEMRMAPGKASLVQAPAAVAVGVPAGVPAIPVAAAPVAAAPVAVAPAPVAVAPAPVAVAPAPAPVAVAPAPVAAPVAPVVAVPAPAPAVAPAPVAPAPAVAPVEVAPAVVAVPAPAPAPVAVAPVAVAPGTVVVTEPGF